MHGSITLHSVEGKGSTFTLRIPLKFTKEHTDIVGNAAVHRHGSRHNGPDDDGGSSKSLSEACTHNHHALSPVPGVKASPLLGAIERPPSAVNGDATVIDARAHARLVGLSAPFFVPSPSASTNDLSVAALEHAVVEASQSGDKVRVLVADDNQVNQEVVLRMLKLEEIYDVSVAKDGQEAYEMVKESMEQEKLYDLIFMDVQARPPHLANGNENVSADVEVDAQSGWPSEYSQNPADGLSSAHRGSDRIC
jgi:osomolarity two-component system sensor histidine kinase SLN1